MGVSFGVWGPNSFETAPAQKPSLGQVDLDKLDDSQKAAVLCEDPCVVIEAPSGSGKTNSLINAICYYHSKHPDDRIAAITYTRAARDEMQRRLDEKNVKNVFVSTVHGWAHMKLEEVAKKHNIKISVLREADIKAILEKLIEDYYPNMIKYAGIFYYFCMVNKIMDVSDKMKKMLNMIQDAYESYKQNNGLYDFNDYPRYLNDILEEYDEYLSSTDALFVDEYQDIDLSQKDIFNRCLTNKKFYIGDPWQSIYIFRGADGSAFDDLDNFTHFKLKYNYRSFQPIIDYATFIYKRGKNLSTAKPIPFSRINCKKGEGGELSVLFEDRTYWKYDTSIEDPKVTHSFKYSAFGTFEKDLRWLLDNKAKILVRSNKQVKAVQEYYQEVSTVHQAKGLEYDYVIVPDMEISEFEEMNIGYVALTRARDKLMVVPWECLMEELYLRANENKKNLGLNLYL